MFQKGEFTIGGHAIDLEKNDDKTVPDEGSEDKDKERSTKRTSGGVTGIILELKIICVRQIFIKCR